VGGVGCGGAGGVGFWAALARRFGIWGRHCLRDGGARLYMALHITKISSSFSLPDAVLSWRAGQNGKFFRQIVEWGRPLAAKILGCAPTLFRIPAETFRVLSFS